MMQNKTDGDEAGDPMRIDMSEERAHGAHRRTPRGRRRPTIWALLRRFVVALIALAMLPVLLTGLYALPFVHPVSTIMVADAVSGGYERDWIGIDEIDPNLVRSIMMSEDGQFCRHYGVDVGEMRAVVNDALAGETTRGASTITMQTVKNLFLWPDRSLLRKAAEIPYSLFLDMALPKRRIMEIYLNIAQFGDRLYGVEAAAQRYYGRSAASLTAEQAARLAVSLPNPYQRNPDATRGYGQLVSLIQRRARASGAYDDCLPGG